MQDEKPDPDQILRAIQDSERNEKLGKLKIFFGMSAGVGKTYAMLGEAQELIKEGVNVVIGTINTHGRKETEQILQGLPLIPEKWVKYKDTVFEELDLDKILELQPDLVLIDELAHTNVPGSKHPKRWQDVMEILDAGIDVYTTLNVQHLESRKEIVEGLIGIQIRETVPDLILERATTIELIDIPPSDLLQRLKEGKVYLGDQSQIAARNFFKVDHLTALREIALRFTAEKVDHDLHGIMSQGKGWKTRERLMVAVSPAPSSQTLIRTTRRIAFQLDAPWVAVYVDTGKVLSDKEQTQLTLSLNLARDLGAEVIATHDVDIATALQRISRQKDITRIIVGRPSENRGFFHRLFEDNFIERLENENKHIDILILRQDPISQIFRRSFPVFTLSSPLVSYAMAFVCIFAISVIGYFTEMWIGYQLIGLFYLLGILILSFFLATGPLLFAAALSSLNWSLIFLPDTATLLKNPFHLGLILAYFTTALMQGMLTSHYRKKEHYLKLREAKMEHLYEIEREIANAVSLESLRHNVTSRLKLIFPGSFDILIKTPDQHLTFDSKLPQLNLEKEKAAALWVFANGKVGGRFTETLPAAEGIYFPIKFSDKCIGILCYLPARQRPLSLDETNFLQTVTQQLGIFLERHLFEDRLRRQEYTLQTEKLHHAVFNSFNRSFYEPFEAILTLHSQLQNNLKDTENETFLKEMESILFSFKLAIDNLITISELESGFIHFEKKLSSIKKLLEESLQEVQPFVNDHPVIINISSNDPLLPFDFNMLKKAVNNLIINACEYSPSEKPVEISLEIEEKYFKLAFIDLGPGIDPEDLPHVFEKFFRSKSNCQRRMGIGLSIVKSVMDIHQGSIEISPSLKEGCTITLHLPL